MARKIRPHKALMRDFQHSLPMVLLRSREGCMQLFRPLLRLNTFTEQQWRVMRVLMEQDGIDISTLAEQCMLLPPSISRIVRDLEKDGMVTRRNEKRDLRRARLYPTAAGRRRFNAAAPAMEECYKHIMQKISAEHLNMLYDLLEELQEAIDDIDVEKIHGKAMGRKKK